MSTIDLRKFELSQLVRLLNHDAEHPCPWRREELGSILRHQLAAPLDELIATAADAGRSPDEMKPDGDCARSSFADLLFATMPARAALEQVKRFAKSQRSRADAVLPDEVASVLYYASIVAGWLRLGVWITDPENALVQEGLRWAVAQEWIDERTRSLLLEAATRLETVPARSEQHGPDRAGSLPFLRLSIG